MLLRLVAAKAAGRITVTPLGILMLSSADSQNAYLPIDLTLLGKTIFFTPLSAKAASPIDLSVLGKDTLVKYLHEEKEYAPMVVTPLDTTTFVILFKYAFQGEFAFPLV